MIVKLFLLYSSSICLIVTSSSQIRKKRGDSVESPEPTTTVNIVENFPPPKPPRINPRQGMGISKYKKKPKLKIKKNKYSNQIDVMPTIYEQMPKDIETGSNVDTDVGMRPKRPPRPSKELRREEVDDNNVPPPQRPPRPSKDRKQHEATYLV